VWAFSFWFVDILHIFCVWYRCHVLLWLYYANQCFAFLFSSECLIMKMFSFCFSRFEFINLFYFLTIFYVLLRTVCNQNDVLQCFSLNSTFYWFLTDLYLWHLYEAIFSSMKWNKDLDIFLSSLQPSKTIFLTLLQSISQWV
jgi:hypothetical protein